MQEFRDQVVTEDEVDASGARAAAGKVLIKDRIADSMFQQIQLRPDEYSVVATPNLNGDYLSDAAAALTGGIGLAAGANIGDRAAMFEATHGTAPKYTGKNMANPGAVLLSGVLLLEHLGWDEAAELVNQGVEATFAESEETAQKRPGRQAVRHLRHRPPVRRLRRRGRRQPAPSSPTGSSTTSTGRNHQPEAPARDFLAGASGLWESLHVAQENRRPVIARHRRARPDHVTSPAPAPRGWSAPSRSRAGRPRTVSPPTAMTWPHHAAP